MLAKDVMRKDVVTVPPFMSLKELCQLFDDRHISGAPVVDKDGKVVGVVSQTDLVRAERETGAPDVGSFHRETDEGAAAAGFHYEEPDHRRVEQIMTPGGLSLEEDATVEEVGKLMLAKRIHRVLVTRHGKLCGIITTMDMLQAFVGKKREPAGRR